MERFSYDLEMKHANKTENTNERKKRDFIVERIQTRVAFGWLSKRSAEKKIHARRTF